MESQASLETSASLDPRVHRVLMVSPGRRGQEERLECRGQEERLVPNPKP
jgi:hypothetical protein